MKFRALGAAGVMGESAHLVELEGAAVVLDAGRDPRTGRTASPAPAQRAGARALVLSHAHLDHAGGLPEMMRGLPGAGVWCTPATRALADLALQDTLRRAAGDAGRGGLPFSDAERRALPWRPVGLEESTPLWSGGPVCTLNDAGHLAGSAGVLLEHRGLRLFYTGDTHLAPRVFSPGARWPEGPVDALVMECTQGANAALDEVTQPPLESAFTDALLEVLAAGGQVLVPTFAFGRAQELVALLARLRAAGRWPEVPVYLGGLAARVNRLLTRRDPALEAAWAGLAIRPLTPAVATAPPAGPALFLAGSGMVAEGSLASLLLERLGEKPENAVFLIGYLDPDTPGFELRAGARRCHAAVRSFPFSAHARRADLVEAAVRLRPRAVVLVHGDETARAWMHATLGARLPAVPIHRPGPGEEIVLR